MVSEIIGLIILIIILGSFLWFLSITSEEEAKKMGIMTPQMGRDPDHLERMERETPFHIKRSREEAEKLARQSQETDLELGEDGVLRKKKY